MYVKTHWLFVMPWIWSVEGLYCKRPIQCLASSKIFFYPPPPPHLLTARRVCSPQPLVRGEDTLDGWRGGEGVNSSEDARHCSVLYICKYFVVGSKVFMEDDSQRPWSFSKCIISVCFQPRISPGSLAKTTPSLPFHQTPPFHAVFRQGYPYYSFFKIKNKII